MRKQGSSWWWHARAMAKPLKIALGAVGALLVLLVAAVAFLFLTFDPNAYKPLLVEQVKARYQRTLSIPGPIGLTLWPWLGVKLGEASLSERNAPAAFASIRSAQVSLAVWPLLKRQVVVDRATLDGLRASVVRNADGTLSIDDLLAKDPAPAPAPAEAAGPPLALDIAGIAVTDAELVYDDRQNQRRVTLSKASLETGRLADGVATPLKLQARLDATAPKLGATLALQGRLERGPAAGRIALQDLKAELGATFEGRDLQVTLEGALDGDGAAQRYAFKPLKIAATLPNPAGGRLAMAAQGEANVTLAGAGRVGAQLSGTFDESRFQARVTMPRLAPAAYTFDAEIDKLDLDRYRAAAPAADPKAPAAPEKPIDLSALRELEASGALRVGAFQVLNLKAANLRVGLKAAGGRVVVDPIAADLYQGRVAGSATVAATSPPRIGLQQQLTGIAIGPLLKDLANQDRLDGKGNVTLDVTTSGATVSAMTKALGGRATLALADGAVRGINVAQTIRQAKARLGGGAGNGTAANTEKTDFSELTGSFDITNGVARNTDLAAKTPLLRIGGAGDVDLGAQRLDYTVKATVVATLEGQGGPELQALRGQTIPVKLSGPFSAIDWKIDFAAMAKEAAGQKIDEKKEQAKERLKEEAREKLGDKLKGLLGK